MGEGFFELVVQFALYVEIIIFLSFADSHFEDWGEDSHGEDEDDWEDLDHVEGGFENEEIAYEAVEDGKEANETHEARRTCLESHDIEHCKEHVKDDGREDGLVLAWGIGKERAKLSLKTYKNCPYEQTSDSNMEKDDKWIDIFERSADYIVKGVCPWSSKSQ